MRRKALFLPGARGDGRYWRPVAELLPRRFSPVFLEWPGLGSVPPDPRVSTFDDLVLLVTQHMDEPVDLIAHSMGGAVAVRAVLECPHVVKHLILSATSGGVDLSRFKAADWRPSYRQNNPTTPDWFLEYREDLSDRIPTIAVPTLLLWGDQDQISPVAAGEYLATLFQNTRLIVIRGGTHTFAEDRPAEVAPYIIDHLSDRTS